MEDKQKIIIIHSSSSDSELLFDHFVFLICEKLDSEWFLYNECIFFVLLPIGQSQGRC